MGKRLAGVDQRVDRQHPVNVEMIVDRQCPFGRQAGLSRNRKQISVEVSARYWPWVRLGRQWLKSKSLPSRNNSAAAAVAIDDALGVGARRVVVKNQKPVDHLANPSRTVAAATRPRSQVARQRWLIIRL